MRDETRRIVSVIGLVIWAAIAAGSARAQDVAGGGAGYPAKSVRMIVPLAQGGGSDIVGRIVAAALADRWGQAVIVDNRPGAGSVVGTSIAVKAKADGYTLLVSSSSIAISPALYANLPFDVSRDLAAVTLLASQPSVLAVHASVPAATLKELIAFAKEKPSVLTYGSAGAGSATHLGAELFRVSAGISIRHVPYKSAGLATTALLAGETQLLLTNMASVVPHVNSGRIRALGISSAKRMPQAPELPTLSEAGLPGFEYSTWYGMLVPAGTPRALVDRLQADTAAVLRMGSVPDRLASLGLEFHGNRPAEFDSLLKVELARWSRIVRASDIRAD